MFVQAGSPHWTRFELSRPEARSARTTRTGLLGIASEKICSPIQTGLPACMHLEPRANECFHQSPHGSQRVGDDNIRRIARTGRMTWPNYL